MSDVITSPDYWDCQCDEDYIISSRFDHCLRCGADREDQPDSREDEVARKLFTDVKWVAEGRVLRAGEFKEGVVRFGAYLGEFDRKPNAWRAVACVNALADERDPEAFVKKARKALEICEKMQIRIEEEKP